MMRKAQSAMEFLMTYGWAILIMLVVISVLFYVGVFSPEGSVPESCVMPAGFSCKDYVISDGYLSLDLGQATGKTVLITSIACTAKPGEPTNPTVVNITINNGRHEIVANGDIPCFLQDGITQTGNGDAYRGKVIFIYQEVETGIWHVAEGEVSSPKKS
jgi:hypothetical protein